MNGPLVGIACPIGDRVLAYWSHDGKAENLRLLRHLDSDYFLTVAKAMRGLESGRAESIAVSHLRLLRDHAAETLFALLGAFVQAPRAVALWMIKYSNTQLDSLVKSFTEGTSIRTHIGTQTLRWPKVLDMITPHHDGGNRSDSPEETLLWARFVEQLANEFLDDTQRRIYASLKHGLRVWHGGANIRLGQASLDPQSAQSELQWHELNGSGYGIGFFVDEPIVGVPKGHHGLGLVHQNVSPEALHRQLCLIACLINNATFALRMANDDDGTSHPMTWTRVENNGIFEDCWKCDGELARMRFSPFAHAKFEASLTEADMKRDLDSLPSPEP